MKIKSILISQPQPQKSEPSPYLDLAKKNNIKIDFHPFIQVVGVPCREVRVQKIDLSQFTALILTSKNAIDHFFRIAEEMRFSVPDKMKYFCQSETIANYLQRYIVYRKRKIYFGAKTLEDLEPFFMKHPNEKFLLPSSDILSNDIPILLNKFSNNWTRCIMYKTVSNNLSKLKRIKYDLLVFFSPQEIKSLFENFPNFKQENTLIAALGINTIQIANKYGLIINISPTKKAPSLISAIENYLKLNK